MPIETDTHIISEQLDFIFLDLIQQYKKRISIYGLGSELDKWKLIQQYKNKPDLTTYDFAEELGTIKYKSFIYHGAKQVIDHILKEQPEAYKQHFQFLFDESYPLTERINSFGNDIAKLYGQLEEKYTHHHDERTIATFLAFYNPEKYTLYKNSFYKELCDRAGIMPKPKGEKYVHYLQLIDVFIKHYILKDEALLALVEQVLPVEAYQDPTHTLLAQDILYTTLEKEETLTTYTQNLESEQLEETTSTYTSPLNQILYGPPGTGKTYHTIYKALSIIEEKDESDLKQEEEHLIKQRFDTYTTQEQITFTTFHQSMSYEDFIEGIKPVLHQETKQLSYIIAQGVFKRIATLAHENTDQSYVLIIDEINRGNVSQIFGELITAIEADKRFGHKDALSITLPYSKEAFTVPKNLYIIGTMNTADRSIEALDTALRRRFAFIEMMPELAPIAQTSTLSFQQDKTLTDVLDIINKRIAVLLDRDHMLGHSYLMHIETTEALAATFKNNIIPLLQEYFYNDYGKIGLVLGKGFVQKVTLQPHFSFDYEGKEDFDKTAYTLQPIHSEMIIQAINWLLD